MNKRSYLDTLNAGRQRRPHATLDELNRSLRHLEEQIGRTQDRNDERRPREYARQPEPREYARQPEPREYARQPEPKADYHDYGARLPEEPNYQPRGGYDRPAYNPPPAPEPKTRAYDDSHSVNNRISGELKSLREELRSQMTSGLRREFDGLRKDIDRSFHSSPLAKGSAELGLEFERLSDAIHMLSERGDDRGVNVLRLEMEQVKAAIDSLAREETLLSVDRRWEDFDQRMSAFQERVSADVRQRREDPAIAALTDRLEQIGAAVNGLPDSLPLRSLEEKVRTLAGAVDHFSRQDRGSQPFDQIEERLDEISRAIVASSLSAQAPQFDPEPLERIEARITALARQIEDVAGYRPDSEVVDRLNTLSDRVDQIAVRATLPDQAMERLGRQIAAIAERIDTAPPALDTEAIFRGIEQRFDVLSGMIERRQGDAMDQANLLFRDLERRLDEVVDRLDHQPQASTAEDGIMNAIDQRFADFARKLDSRKQTDASDVKLQGLETRLDAISTKLDSRKQSDASDVKLQGLETRLDAISTKLDSRKSTESSDTTLAVLQTRLDSISSQLDSRKPSDASDAKLKGLETRLDAISSKLSSSAAQPGNMDPALIRSLESQVAELAAHLSRPSEPVAGLTELSPRLDQIEKTIVGSRDSILEAARQAAEAAVRNLGASQADSAAASGLAQDLKTLESLTRRSDERNTKTFEAIHDTLLKVVDRLGTMERPAGRPEAPQKLAVQAAPSLDMEPATPLPPVLEDVAHAAPDQSAKQTRSPAEAAAAAAVAALDDEDETGEVKGRGRSSLFGGLTRAFSGRKEREEPQLAGSAPVIEAEAPEVALDEPLDPKAANRPLEPGSGAPDINAIMKRVRDERSQPAKAREADAAKSDFIAAARRAAQAAAAEAEILKRQSDVKGSGGKSKLGDLLKARRKPILMAAAAIMIALAGLQLSKAFFAEQTEVVSIEPAPAVEETPMADVAGIPAIETEAPAPVAATTEEMPVEPAAPEAGSEVPMVDDQAAATPGPDLVAQAVPETSPVKTAAVPTAPEEAAPAAAAPVETAVSAIEVPDEAGPLPLREAAAGGDSKALFEIGSRYADGRGIKADMTTAAKWYEKSAELGFAPAQYRIGNFYEKGLGVDRDVAKAKSWYQLAANQGNASAMHNLAVLFAMGADGTTDNDAAARWFIDAANLGVKDSQFNLGILSAKGVGMPQNLEESYKWFALVAKTGDKDAAAKRDEVATSLRPDQLESARAAVEAWKPKPLEPEANTVEIPESWQESDGKTASVEQTVDMKQVIVNIQRILNKNGYDAGGTDGVMGQKTKTAIAAFQKDNGLEPSGEVDEKLVKLLLERK